MVSFVSEDDSEGRRRTFRQGKGDITIVGHEATSLYIEVRALGIYKPWFRLLSFLNERFACSEGAERYESGVYGRGAEEVSIVRCEDILLPKLNGSNERE